jgi:nitrite reductase (NAD(P)H)
MGVDVASFGDFFADMRPVEVQAQTRAVSRIGQRPISPTKGVKHVHEDKARPSVEVVIDDTAMSGKPMVSKPPALKGRGDKMDQPIKCLVYKDPFGSTYKKYIFTADGKYLLGGQMIGDVGDYVKLVAIVKKQVLINLLGRARRLTVPQKALEVAPSQFIVGTKKEGGDAGEDLGDDDQVCSCHVSNHIASVDMGSSLRCVRMCRKAGFFDASKAANVSQLEI